jgi:hypothetical protein
MEKYYVFRTGWNLANQPSAYCRRTELVWQVNASSAEDAERRASRHVSCYNGQYLTARMAADCQAEEEADGSPAGRG